LEFIYKRSKITDLLAAGIIFNIPPYNFVHWHLASDQIPAIIETSLTERRSLLDLEQTIPVGNVSGGACSPCRHNDLRHHS